MLEILHEHEDHKFDSEIFPNNSIPIPITQNPLCGVC